MLKLLTASVSIFASTIAFGQAAEVPRSAANGDYQSALLPGNRGMYLQDAWLVIDQDKNGLNCRHPDNHNVVVRKFDTGAIVKALGSFPVNFNGYFYNDAIDSNLPPSVEKWLIVSTLTTNPGSGNTPTDPQNPKVCVLRANRNFIAPINIDYLPRLP